MAVLLAACTSAPSPTTTGSSSPTLAPSLFPSGSASPGTTPAATPTASPGASVGPSPTSTPIPTITPSGPLATRLDAQLRQVLDQQRTTLNIPGISAAITFPDGSTWTAAFGLAEIQPARAAATCTPFVVGSV